MFAKIFESEKYGQILVVKGQNDDGEPEVKFQCEPPLLGICHTALTFEEDDDGWNKMEEAFKQCDLGHAEKAVEPIFAISKDMEGKIADN